MRRESNVITTLPPNWNANSHRRGGHIGEIPLPHVRRFPGPPGEAKRRVQVFPAQIFRHFHTSITEEDNPIWDGREGMWTDAWDDDEGKGRQLFKILDTKEDVGVWVAKMVALYFADGDHEVLDHMEYIGAEIDMPDYLREARQAARRAAKREGD